MKNIIVAIVLALFFIHSNVNAQSPEQLVRICSSSAGADATYLKDFQVQLEQANPDQRPPFGKFSVVLQKNTKYRFTICNSEDSPGKAILQLFDANRLLGSSYNAATGKEYKSFNFPCTKTGVYHIFISFQEGKSGSGCGILSFVKKM